MRSRVSGFAAGTGGGVVVVVAVVAGFDGDGVFAERVDLMEDLDPGSGIADAVDEALFFWVRRCRQRHVRM